MTRISDCWCNNTKTSKIGLKPVFNWFLSAYIIRLVRTLAGDTQKPSNKLQVTWSLAEKTWKCIGLYVKLTHQNQIPVIKRSNFQMKFSLAASADVDHRLFYLHVFSMGLFFKLHNLLLAAVCHDILKKSSHLKTCNLVPVCHRL